MAFHETDAYIPGDAGGACYFCRADQRNDRGTRERLFRSDADTYDGFIVICESCVSELAGHLGWISPAKAKSLENRNRDLRKENREVLDALAAATALVDAQRHYGEVVGVDG